jgi:hypothetical protein
MHTRKSKMFKKILLATLVAASAAAIPVASYAQRQVIVNVAPPAARQEAVPAPRRGFVWVPGHHEWRQRQHVWISGHWLKARQGYAYNAPQWSERNGKWVMREGQWVRSDRARAGDRDGDGVPNRRDARPNNPNRS